VYPIWKDALIRMFSDGTKTTVVLTGSTNTGKSSVAIFAIAYIQYTHMLLREPWHVYNLADSGKMVISFFNLNKNLGSSKGYNKLQTALFRSPWFKKHAVRMSKVRSDFEGTETGELEFQLIDYVLSSPQSRGFGILGQDIVSGVLDEVDDPITSVKQKEKVIEVFKATEIRFKNRFASTGYSLGKLFIVSSKQDEMSFIDTFIAQRKNFADVLIFDIPLWEAKPKHLFSGLKFPVAIGDSYHPPKMVSIRPDVPVDQQSKEFQEFSEEYVRKGYQIINVPVEFKKEFQLDLIGSIKDIAGQTIAGIRKTKLFASEPFILACIDKTKQDPVNVPEIVTGLQDEINYIKYFDLSKIRVSKTIPRYIHYDISFSGDGDACSLSCACAKEWKVADIQNDDGTYRKELLPVIETDFTVRIRAHSGDRIPFHKVRRLVLDLRAAGYNIALFTADLKNMSEDTQQLLAQAGITTDDLSLDRSPQPYFSFRDLVYEGRWVCHHIPLLIKELSELEHNLVEGKVDHPAQILLEDGRVVKGSKDQADATAGAIYDVFKNAVKPMDIGLMTDLMKRTAGTPQPLEEDVTKLLTPKEEGKERIIGTKTNEGIDKINEVFKRLHRGGI